MDEPFDAGLQPPPPSRGHLPLITGILAALALVAGVATLIASNGQEMESFGWFAYAPLSEDKFTPGLHVVSTQQIIGWLLVAMAACVAAFWAGLTLRRRPN
ncbi:MAG: hypothetical protein Q4P23_12190 [Micrococcaceae bacterium]|nr:hypothetical protein [Micrococcaceae bacterium]